MTLKSQSIRPSSPQVLDTPPSAARIAIAIAAFPYSPRVALLDIMDNSVENDASGVSLTFAQKNKVISSIIIADNGSGIAPEILDEVLRAGSRTSHLYRDQSLSRFGVGLKGAGFALGHRISVFTRPANGKVFRRSIDLDEIQRTDVWFQETRDPNAEEVAAFESALSELPGDGQKQYGTVVIIESVTLQTRDLARLKSDIVRSVGEAYAKFLGAVGGISKLSVRVDGADVEPIDPLHRENERTLTLFKREEVTLADGTTFFFSAVALPHPNTIEDEIRRKYRYTQKDQGIYVYRNGRLIMGGQTLDLFGRDFHLNAFRAELDYTTAADRHVRVDVAKSTTLLSPEATAALQPLIKAATSTADTLWREKDVLTRDDIAGLFDESNRLIGSRQKLLVEAASKRKMATKAQARKVPPATRTNTGPTPTPQTVPGIGATGQKTGPGMFLRPQDTLPEDFVYRPWFENGDFMVEVSLAHPFSKAVFEVPPGEGKKGLQRRATTAIQQLIYLLGYCEWGLTDEPETREMFEQFRRYLSMNLRALLAE